MAEFYRQVFSNS